MNPLKAILLATTLATIATAATPSTAPTTRPTTTAVTQPTAPNLQYHECAVFVLDASTGQINPDGIITATLPAFITDHRYGSASTPVAVEQPQFNRFNNFMVINGRVINMGGVGGGVSVEKTGDVPTPLDEPSPIGIIRLTGSVDSKVDVSLSARSGTFAGSWPKAEDRPNQVLWRDLTVSDQPVAAASPVAPQNWFAKLRSADSAFVSLAHAPSEKFLLYDLQLPYSSPLKVKAGKDFSYEVSNSSGAILHDLTLYRGDDKDGWRTASVGDLPASSHPQPITPLPAPARGTRLGVGVADVGLHLDVAKSAGFNGTEGVVVQLVLADTPAAGKLLVGDVITEIGGEKIKNTVDLLSKTASAPQGAALKFKFFRGGLKADGNEVEITLAGPPTTTPATKPAEAIAPTTKPADAVPVNHTYTLAATATTQPADLAGTWKTRLTGAGIDPTDAEMIDRVIVRYAFDARRLTAVYRMDDAEFDHLLPLEVVPQPAKITRFGIMIVINADPSAGNIVDDLIRQLGDDDWTKRDTAYHALAAMGPAATDKLKTASKDKDLEIAWRAERLLALNPQAPK